MTDKIPVISRYVSNYTSVTCCKTWQKYITDTFDTVYIYSYITQHSMRMYSDYKEKHNVIKLGYIGLFLNNRTVVRFWNILDRSLNLLGLYHMP